MKKTVFLVILVFGIFFLGACSSKSSVSITPIQVTSVPTQTMNEPSKWNDVISISGKDRVDDAAFFKAKEKFIAELIKNDEFAFCGEINDQESFGRWYDEAMAPSGGGIFWPKEAPKGRETHFAGRKAIAFPASSIVSYYTGMENTKVKKEKMSAAFGCADFPVHPGEIIKVDHLFKFSWEEIGVIKYNPQITTDLNASSDNKVRIYRSDGRWQEGITVSHDGKSIVVGFWGNDDAEIYSYFIGLGKPDKFVPAKVVSWRSNQTDKYIVELRFEIIDPDVWERADWRYVYPTRVTSEKSITKATPKKTNTPNKTETMVWSNEEPDQKIQGVLDKSSLWIAGDQVTVAIRVSQQEAENAKTWTNLSFQLGKEKIPGKLGAVTDPRDGSGEMILTIKLAKKESLKIEGKK